MTPADKKRILQALTNQANKRAKGRKVIAMAEEVPNTFLLRRPCGIAQLDIDTGGGLPAGGLSYLSGPDGAGKTLLLWKYFAMQQRLYGKNCVLGYAATEAAPDYFFARKCGVQIAVPDEMIESRSQQRKELGLPAFTKEERANFKSQVGEFVIFRGYTAEELLDNILVAVEKNIFNIIGLDSVSALLPGSEAALESVADFGQQGAHANLLQKFMKKYCPLTLGLEGQNETSLVFIAQVRSNRKKSEMPSYMAKWEQDWAPSGSWMSRHTKLMDITVWSGSFDKEKGKDGTKIILGKTMNWKLTKGKVGTHDGICGDTEIVFDDIGHEMNIRSLLPSGIRYGAITEKDGVICVVGMDKLKNIPNPDAFVELLKKDPELEMSVRRRVLADAGVECIYA